MYVCVDNLPVPLVSSRPPTPLLLLDEIYFVVEDHNLILHLQVMQTGVHLLLGEGRVLLRQTLGERAQTGHLHHAIKYPIDTSTIAKQSVYVCGVCRWYQTFDPIPVQSQGYELYVRFVCTVLRGRGRLLSFLIQWAGRVGHERPVGGAQNHLLGLLRLGLLLLLVGWFRNSRLGFTLLRCGRGLLHNRRSGWGGVMRCVMGHRRIVVIMDGQFFPFLPCWLYCLKHE